jgi:hypothetical protein
MLIKNKTLTKNKIILLVLILLIIGGAVAYFTRPKETPQMAEYRNVARHVLSTHKKSHWQENTFAACTSEDCKTVEEIAKEDKKEKPQAAGDDELLTMFEADVHGNLVLSESARLNIEKLYALNTPEELAEKMQKLSGALPEMAHRQVGNLLDYYEKYTQNLVEAYPPEVEPVSLGDMLERFRGMHDLRLAYFGADAASAFYAAEEKITLQLLYLMANEKDESLSLEEKAQRAQHILQTSPELAAAYDPDRE